MDNKNIFQGILIIEQDPAVLILFNRVRGQLKCDGTRAETRFRLSAKPTSPFKSAVGVSSVDYW